MGNFRSLIAHGGKRPWNHPFSCGSRCSLQQPVGSQQHAEGDIDALQGLNLPKSNSDILPCLEGQGDLVSRSITHIVTLNIPVISLLTKSLTLQVEGKARSASRTYGMSLTFSRWWWTRKAGVEWYSAVFLPEADGKGSEGHQCLFGSQRMRHFTALLAQTLHHSLLFQVIRMKFFKAVATIGFSFAAAQGNRRSELLPRAEVEKLGIVWRGNATNQQSTHDLLEATEYPSDFSWCNKDGKSYCTMSRNQHIPQYCGSCWAHGAISALGDRIKIARNAQGVDINLAVQHLLNCGGVGTCKGGSVDGPYQWLMEISKKGTGISYETANPYVACSSDSDEGFCKHVDTSCKALNVARTCGSFSQELGR